MTSSTSAVLSDQLDAVHARRALQALSGARGPVEIGVARDEGVVWMPTRVLCIDTDPGGGIVVRAAPETGGEACLFDGTMVTLFLWDGRAGYAFETEVRSTGSTLLPSGASVPAATVALPRSVRRYSRRKEERLSPTRVGAEIRWGSPERTATGTIEDLSHGGGRVVIPHPDAPTEAEVMGASSVEVVLRWRNTEVTLAAVAMRAAETRTPTRSLTLALRWGPLPDAVIADMDAMLTAIRRASTSSEVGGSQGSPR
jgi:c-di-GMP-binding flagellar brake protein YcgR